MLYGAAACFLILGAALAALALFRVRYRMEWESGKRWSAEFEYGFPRFVKTLRFPAASSPAAFPAAVPPLLPPPNAQRQAGFLRLPRRFQPDRRRLRRAAFKLATNGGVLRRLSGFVLRFGRLLFRCLDPSVDGTVSHSDPSVLGRMAGAWEA